MTSGRTGRVALAVAGVGAIAIAVYLPTIRTYFVGDDFEEIWGAHISGPQATERLHAGRNFRPLNQLMHDVNYRLAGTDPLSYHLSSVLLHLVAAGLVVLVARALLSDRPEAVRRWAPLAAGGLFAVMPNHVEAVGWISARSDLTMTCGLLASLWCWLRSDAGRARWWLAGSIATFAVALASKETAVTLPLVLSILEAMRARRGERWRAAMAAWPMWAALAIYLVVRRWSLGTVKAGSFRKEFIGDSFAGLAKHTGELVVRTVLPGMPPAAWVVVVVLAVAAAVAIGRSLRRAPRRAPWQVGFLVVAPVVSLLPVGHLGASPFGPGGDRLVYFSSAFAAIGAGWALAALSTRVADGRVPLAVGGALAVVCAVALLAGNLGWGRAGTLSRRVVASMSRLPRDEPVYLLAMPDNLGTDIVLRNGAGHALVFAHGWPPDAEVAEIAAYRAGSVDERASVRPGPAPNTWRLTLPPDAEFVPTADGDTWDVVGVDADRSGRRLDVRFDEPVAPEQIWYVSDGRLRSAADDEAG